MNVTVDTQAFVKALKAVKPAVAPRSSLRTLAGVHLSCNGDGRLHLRATDLDTMIATSIPAQVNAAGEVIVHHRTLSSLVRGSGKVQLEATQKDKNLPPELTVTPVVIQVGTIATLSAEEPKEWPRAVEPPKAKPFILPLGAIRRCLPAVSHDEARPILRMMSFDGDEIAGTDSYRLHVERVPTARFPRFMLDRKVLELALKAPAPVTASIDFHRKSPGSDVRDIDKIELRGADGTVISLQPRYTTASEYPNYRQLIPKNLPFWLTFETQAFLDALGDVRRFLVDGGAPFRMAPKVAAGAMEIASIAQDVGMTLATIPCEFSGGPPPNIAFSPRYMAEAIAQAESGRVSLGVLDSLKPVIIIDAEANRESPQGLRLLMPVRVA